ncbi:IS3 family transposase [Peribacillus simplex]|uniref:IS3 family transposase n=1 Tax=Peribacillus simplex TaxID=1478 RepID=UPI00366E7F65
MGAREQRLKKDHDLMEKMLSIHIQHKEFGYPRMQIALREEGLVNNKKVYRLMKLMEIQSVIRKKWRLARRDPKCILTRLTGSLKTERKTKFW